MIHRRAYFGMSAINSSHIIVLGGISNYDGKSTVIDKIEVYDGAKWYVKKEAPFKVHSGCLLPLNESHLIAVGGTQKDVLEVHFLWELKFPIALIILILKYVMLEYIANLFINLDYAKCAHL